jgi:hypothetical protein
MDFVTVFEYIKFIKVKYFDKMKHGGGESVAARLQESSPGGYLREKSTVGPTAQGILGLCAKKSLL